MSKLNKLNSITQITQNDIKHVVGAQFRENIFYTTLVGVNVILITGMFCFLDIKYQKEIAALRRYKALNSL